jgi:hypothetical protein
MTTVTHRFVLDTALDIVEDCGRIGCWAMPG